MRAECRLYRIRRDKFDGALAPLLIAWQSTHMG